MYYFLHRSITCISFLLCRVSERGECLRRVTWIRVRRNVCLTFGKAFIHPGPAGVRVLRADGGGRGESGRSERVKG